MKRHPQGHFLRQASEPPLTDRAVRVLAHSIYQSLKEDGCQDKDIIGISSQLIGLVSSTFAAADPAAQNPQEGGPQRG